MKDIIKAVIIMNLNDLIVHPIKDIYTKDKYVRNNIYYLFFTLYRIKDLHPLFEKM